MDINNRNNTRNGIDMSVATPQAYVQVKHTSSDTPFVQSIDALTEYMIDELNEADEVVLLPELKPVKIPCSEEVYTYTRFDGSVGVIDLSLSARFKTPYVVLHGIPECFNGNIHDYKKIIGRISDQLERCFNAANVHMNPHRKKTYKYLLDM